MPPEQPLPVPFEQDLNLNSRRKWGDGASIFVQDELTVSHC